MSISIDDTLTATTTSHTAATSTQSGFAVNSFKNILSDKITSAKDDLRKMNAQRQALKMLTDNQNVTEVIRRIMPDGSIRVTKYCGNKIKSSHRVMPNNLLASNSNSSSALQEDADFMNQQKLKLALEPVILTDLLMM